MSLTKAENYVHDLICILVDQLNDLEKEMLSCKAEDKDYLKG